MKFFTICLVCSLALSTMLNGQDAAASWTWLYQKIFSAQELAAASGQKVVSFSKDSVPPFTQLMFSWNAVRPAQGHFSFWVQARHKNKRWGQWHKMIDWGAGIQRSYSSSSQGTTNYCHVRLEMGKEHADAFAIKIVAHNGAQLSDLRAIFVSVSDFDKFASEVGNQFNSLTTIELPNIPKISQMALDHPRNHSICSPTSCSMLVSYLLRKEVNVADFAQQAYDAGLDAYGSWPFNMACAYEYCNGTHFFAAARLNSFYGLYQRLVKGFPVVVSVRGQLDGAPKVYYKGHLLMVIGYDAENQRVICHDPAHATDHEVLTSYPLKSFLAAWERSNRLVYLAEFNGQQGV